MTLIPGPPDVDGVALVHVDQEVFLAAVLSQRPVVRAMLTKAGCIAHIEDVMANLHTTLWWSLNKWHTAQDSPDLGRWAHGVATNVVREWLRTERPGRVPGDLPAVVIDTDVVGPETGAVETRDDVAEAAVRVVEAIRLRILSRPGGAAQWERLIRDVHRPTTGVNARRRLREELEALYKETQPTPSLEPTTTARDRVDDRSC